MYLGVMLTSDMKFGKRATLKLQETWMEICSTWNAFLKQKNKIQNVSGQSNHMLESVGIGTPSRGGKKAETFHNKHLPFTTEHTRLRQTF